MDQSSDRSLPAVLPEGLTPEAQQAMNRFLKAYQNFIARLQTVSLRILVWGPSFPASADVGQLRRVIVQKLIEDGHAAALSEEVVVRGTGLSLKSEESALASAADMIVILVDGTPNALSEAWKFAYQQEVASKLYIYAPARLREDQYLQEVHAGLDRLAGAYGNVYWYHDDEVINGKLLSIVLTGIQALCQRYVAS